MKISVSLKGCDLWVGAYWDRENRTLYICPLPTVALRLELNKPPSSGMPYPHCRDDCGFVRDGKCSYLEMHIPTIAVDFDRVLFHHTTWNGHEQYGEPIAGAREALKELRCMGFRVMIWTTRNQREVIVEALHRHDIQYDFINENPNQPPEINPSKPAADYYIDDRAVRFMNWPQVLAEIREREITDPYYREKKGGQGEPQPPTLSPPEDHQ